MNPALVSLFIAAFAVGTTEFVPAGLVPEISSDLHVSIPVAGLLISAYAAGVAIGGPIISLLTSRFPRKPTMLALMGVFVAGHVFAALAPDYTTLMAARIVISLSHGSYFGLMAIITMSLVPPERQGAAIAFTFAGISVANLLGVPLGTFIGNAFGWRASFWVVGSIGVVAALAMLVFIPRDAAPQRDGARLGDQFRMLGRQEVYLPYAMIVAMMIGFFAFVTFVAPWLTEVGHVPAGNVPWVLLLFGLGATIGIFVGGRLNDRFGARVLLWMYPLQVIVFVAAVWLGTNPIAAGAFVLLVGLANLITNSALQTRILRGAAEAPDLASTLISSVYNTGIAIGAYLAAAALDRGLGYDQIPWFGAVSSAIAGIIAILALARLMRSQPA